MTRYPGNEPEFVYRCIECGNRLPDFQGAFWFVREREIGDGTIEIPYCPECDSASITSEQI